MILLSLTVRNHRSIRDEITLDLTTPSLRTLKPRDDRTWAESTYPLLGILGANATGKSAILDALTYMFAAIHRSATVWQEAPAMLRRPFALDPESRDSSSTYEIDFVLDDRRHRYGFEVDADGIVAEWLYDLPRSRWRTRLERDRDSGRLVIGGRPAPLSTVTDRELVLSRALLLRTSPLHTLARSLVDRVDVVRINDSYRRSRLQSLADSLAEGATTFADIRGLLQIADIGVKDVSLREDAIPDALLDLTRKLKEVFSPDTSTDDDTTDDDSSTARENDGAPSTGTPDPSPEAPDGPARPEDPDAVLRHVVRSLTFTHHGDTGEAPEFSIDDESAGTVAWLVLAVPALEALRRGGLLIVDEIDSSLHPHLLDILLTTFADPAINTRHAQLIFTAHDANILSPLSTVPLAEEQIWFTDKTREGVTELTCLADFSKHPDANRQKRYLSGVYGGVPHLSPSIFARLIDTDS